LARDRVPKTPAIRLLDSKQISYEVRLYSYEDHGGTHHAAEELGIPEHQVVKTLVLEADHKSPLIVLMHGDRSVSTKQLARQIDTKRVVPCDPHSAHKHTGYVVGGISPFGTRAELPVYVEKTILGLDRIVINGGRRGLLLEIDPRDLPKVLDVEEVEVGIAD